MVGIPDLLQRILSLQLLSYTLQTVLAQHSSARSLQALRDNEERICEAISRKAARAGHGFLRVKLIAEPIHNTKKCLIEQIIFVWCCCAKSKIRRSVHLLLTQIEMQYLAQKPITIVLNGVNRCIKFYSIKILPSLYE